MRLTTLSIMAAVLAMAASTPRAQTVYDPISGQLVSGMRGATAEAAGGAGAVPAPAAGDQAKALLGDGTWGAVVAAEVDPDHAAWLLTVTPANWDTAYGWGDHALAGYLTAEADTLATVTGRGATTTNAITLGGATPLVFDGATAGTHATTITVTDPTAANTITLPDKSGTIAMTTDAIPPPASPAQGDILYYNGTAWVILTAGTADHVLTTKGAAQNPVWAAGGGGGGFPYVRVLIESSGNQTATDASAGGIFDLVLTENTTLSNPTNGVDGQPVKWRIKASGSNRTVTLGNAFRIPSSSLLTSPITITSAKTSYFAAIFNNTDSKWDVVSFVEGY